MYLSTFKYHLNHKISRLGFTLVEMLIVIGISTVLMMVITASITSLYKNNSYTFAQANEIDSARRGLQTWVKDAREMTYAVNGAYAVVSLEDNEMSFYSDIDHDNAVEYVRYILNGTTLEKRIHNPSGSPAVYNMAMPDSVEILSEYIQNGLQNVPIFNYYDSAGVELVSPATMISDVRYITMHIIVNIDPLRSPGEFMLQGSAAPRNLKDNL